MEDCDIGDCTMPDTWARLQRLNLSCNKMTRLPEDLSALTSLSHLDLSYQQADLQITEPMQFLTQMQNLRFVRLIEGEGRHWSAGSQFAFMQAQMMIDGTPGCDVKLAVRSVFVEKQHYHRDED